jgi:hypothetical protein
MSSITKQSQIVIVPQDFILKRQLDLSLTIDKHSRRIFDVICFIDSSVDVIDDPMMQGAPIAKHEG